MQNILSRVIEDAQKKWERISNKKLKKAGLTWLKLRKLKYSSSSQISAHTLKGQQVYFKNRYELIHSLREIFIEEIYKLKSDISQPYIIDCGANIGLSVIYMKRQFPESKILAFEPDKANFELLEKNTIGFADVEIKQNAVWESNTFISFANTGTLSSQIIPNIANNNTEIKIIKAVRLRDYLNKPVFFLKLDIEGAEYRVLKDCADRLGLVENLFIEYHGQFHQINELTEIFNLLYQNGFSYYIKEAANVYNTPFARDAMAKAYDIQLNIFCFKVKYSA